MAISLKDKVPRSPQQRFSRFSTWIREQDPPNLPFSYFTQIGVLWAEECVFHVIRLIGLISLDFDGRYQYFFIILSFTITVFFVPLLLENVFAQDMLC